MRRKIRSAISLMLSLAILATAFVFALPASAEEIQFTTANIFNNNVVLQRQMELRIFGTAPVGAGVEVKLTGGEPAIDVSGNATSDAEGNWIAKLPAQEAGTGYTMDLYLNGELRKTVTNVAIGELWLACGQSNMARGLNQSMDYDDYTMMSDFDRPNIRWVNLQNGGWQWESGHTETQGGAFFWSIVATHFADNLHDALNGVPIGILQNAVPGVSVHTYLSEEHLAKTPALAGTWDNNNFYTKQGSLYEAIKTVIPAAVRGMIWYQGETDVNLLNYDEYLVRMMDCYRTEFQCPNMAFIQTQLPQWTVSDCGLWPYQRERQEKADAAMENAGMATGIDLYEGSSLHPSNKGIIAGRMSDLAMKICYGADNTYPECPTYAAHTIVGNKVTVSFKDVGRGIEVSGPYASVNPSPYGFQIAGADGVYHNATSSRIISAQTTYKVEISCRDVAEPKYIRYNFTPTPTCNLYSKDGVPVAPFRTDTQTQNMNDPGYSTYVRLPWPTPEKGVDETQLTISPTTYNQTYSAQPSDVITEGDIVLNADKTSCALFTFDLNIPTGYSVNRAYFRLHDKETGETQNGTAQFGIYKTSVFNPTTTSWSKMPASRDYNLMGAYNKPGVLLNDNNIDMGLDASKVVGTKLYMKLDVTGYSVSMSASVFDKAYLYINTVKTPDRIELESAPLDTDYVVGQSFNPSGMKVRAYYADGTNAEVYSYAIDKTALSLGDDKVTLTYAGQTLTVPITVAEKQVISLKYITKPTKIEYAFGEALDLTGGVVQATYNDGEKVDMPITADMVSGYNPDSPGLQTVTVTVGEKKLTFTVTVIPKPSEVMLGDLNGDTKITILDAVSIFKMLSGKTTMPVVGSDIFIAADCNRDGKITIIDAIAIFKHVAGKQPIETY